MEHPKLAILSLMSKFYSISWLEWMQEVVHMLEYLYEWGEETINLELVNLLCCLENAVEWSSRGCSTNLIINVE
ncbi:unnamed protein product [Sphenostylis stenocarpa]|uniref:Uncharacterized protein n=1 Tax=Sphenostylis stenocarpa TaxID=92480 RepID=A0AA86V435_9FABA|nr:unnamed protein product [Sphenostylis stenocarpa]